ncbi:PrsW family intramembrane metalloprotease [Companilactobacillus sp.]|uniref:PrsW family intramembrane metalloprotease n=1 Tax=Companilactobacillus sp. TaxID=2767905 RepID=UPI0025C47718|nr:PrsW family intramembrane metalloprotease [Companilactobacillus sp.]MCH4009380.1 PrsW family intramembrane metalloprotease [Companilactobacillus sp.]MCH4050441.1 PrsW family intramembrane metalloprotease [Companilactobacillus sp.]MCH4077322.1 PrsW family intramembrane metalloprotease [Companilactobacillus sp.]MCH4125898.1 PrsW family intramembrane metalloprotease [Companilactobacillus sp.]MCI1311607.1 PrsW family intramembrane metalloprotease [Companilactobacillus sp.]
MKFCVYCGNKIPESSSFCPHCGQQQPKVQRTYQHVDNNQPMYNQSIYPVHRDDLFDKITSKLNSYTGGSGSVRINLKVLFSEVFKKHSNEDAEKIFIAGTHFTTPNMKDVSEEWAKPWLFSRILAYFMVVFGVLIVADFLFGGQLALPGLILVAATAVPFSAVIFYFEFNAFRNISIFTVTKIFFVGGAFSLLVTMFIYQFAIFNEKTSIGIGSALLIGIIEELGKMIIIFYFINRVSNNFILNGILIGGAVGAGFATFETAGYILYSGKYFLITAIVRALTAIGGHLVWAAITGGALMLVKKYGEKLQVSDLFEARFVIFFGLSIILHALWDVTVPFGWLKYIPLIIIAWIILFVLMNAGINQIRDIKHQYNQ